MSVKAVKTEHYQFFSTKISLVLPFFPFCSYQKILVVHFYNNFNTFFEVQHNCFHNAEIIFLLLNERLKC